MVKSKNAKSGLNVYKQDFSYLCLFTGKCSVQIRYLFHFYKVGIQWSFNGQYGIAKEQHKLYNCFPFKLLTSKISLLMHMIPYSNVNIQLIMLYTNPAHKIKVSNCPFCTLVALCFTRCQSLFHLCYLFRVRPCGRSFSSWYQWHHSSNQLQCSC